MIVSFRNSLIFRSFFVAMVISRLTLQHWFVLLLVFEFSVSVQLTSGLTLLYCPYVSINIWIIIFPLIIFFNGVLPVRWSSTWQSTKFVG